MKKLALILLFAPLFCVAQDDVYPKDIENTEKHSAPFYIKNFETGTLVMIDNTIRNGLIKYNGTLLFKNTDESKKEKIDPLLVQKFYTERDTFVVAKNITFSYQNLAGLSTKEFEYLKQVESGKASLYKFFVKSGTGTPGLTVEVANYYISTSDSKYVFIPANKKKFIAVIVPLLKDNVELVRDIEDRKLGYGDIEAIVKRYNSGKTNL